MFLNLNLDVRIGDADLDHGMGRGVSAAGERNGFEVLILFALFAEIKVGTDGAFVANSADTEFVVPAGGAVAVDVRMNQVVTGHETFEGRGKVVVDFCESVLGMDARLTKVAVAAEIIVATFETFVSDSDDVLKLDMVTCWRKYLLAFIAMSTVSQASSGRETFSDIIVLRSSLNWTGIREAECMIGMMVIFVTHKAIKTQSEVIASAAHNICNNIR